MRLADGVLAQEGRVEVCVNGVWGSICGTGWNTIDGYVLCKEAGFDDAGLKLHILLVQFTSVIVVNHNTLLLYFYKDS